MMPGCHFMVTSLVVLSAFSLASARPAELPASRGSLVIRPDETVSDVIVRGRQLEVLGRVDGSILVLGSDAIISGRVEGHAAVLGGSLIQEAKGVVGGDVIVIGGTYSRAPEAPSLSPEAQTIVIHEYGDYFREVFQHPWRRLFIPEMTPLYMGQRVLGLLFYFLISLVLIALVPVPLQRAMQILKHSYMSIGVIGLIGMLLAMLGLFLVIRHLPIELAATITLFALLLLFGAYMFGSLAVHLLVGRWVQEWLRRGSDRSNINALLYGMAVFALIFSLPVVGTLAALGLAILSFGVAVTLPLSRAMHPARAVGAGWWQRF